MDRTKVAPDKGKTRKTSTDIGGRHDPYLMPARQVRVSPSGKTRSGRTLTERPTTPRNERNRLSWVFAAELALLVGLLGGGICFLLTSPIFNIRQIRINGLYQVRPKEISAAAEVPPNENIIRYWLKERTSLCRRVVQSDPDIEEATLGVNLPNSLLLNVEERVPSAVLHLQNGYSYLMDSEPVAFKQIAPNQSDLPIVTVPATLNVVLLGKPLPGDLESHVECGYTLMNLLMQRDVGALSGYREVSVDPVDNVTLRLQNGLSIKLGQQDGLPQRLADLETALTADPSLISTAQYLDFTTDRYAEMKKPNPLSSVSGNERPAGTVVPLSAAINQ